MNWTELSLDLTTWTILGERTKNGQPSIVPLSALAQAQLPATHGKELVFPGQGAKHAQYQGWSNGTERLAARINKGRAKAGQAPMPGWRLHDLRRTLATGLQRLGVRLEVTEAVLNHTSGSRAGIVGIYQRHTWADEKRQALDAWAQHVARVVAGKPADTGNVVAFPVAV